MKSEDTRPRYRRLRRALLSCGIAVASLNIWTGSPLLAVWIGSRVEGAGPPTMAAFAVVGLALAGFSLTLVRILAYLDSAYARVTGRRTAVRRHVPWLRSMRGERSRESGGQKPGLLPLEVMLVVSVVLAVAAFEVWFFFYSGSPIDQRSGR